MASNVTRDHHNLRRNLKLNDNYISNDGGDEGLRVNDTGSILIGGAGDSQFFKNAYADNNYTILKAYDNNVQTVEGGSKWYFYDTTYFTKNSDPAITIGCNNNTYSGGKLRVSGQGNGFHGQVNGTIEFAKSIGENEIGAYIYSRTLATDGTLPAAGGENNDDDWPSNLVFGTTADGAATPTDHLTITNAGNVGIGVSDPDTTLEIYKVGTQLKLSGGAADYATFAVADDGALTITTVDADDANGDIILDPDGNIFLYGTAKLFSGVDTIWLTPGSSSMRIRSIFDTDDYFQILTTTNGATTLTTVDAGGTGANLTFNVDGKIDLNSSASDDIELDAGGDITLDAAGGDVTILQADLTIPVDKKVIFGDAGEYIVGDGTDLTIVSSNNLEIDVDGVVEFDGCGVGFDLETPTYNASDTDVDFQTGNKQFVTFDGDNIADLNLIFPKVSGNFLLMLKQDGAGGRTVTYYKVWDRVDSAAASGSATVKFAGGGNPTLTTDANYVDILSFFYDADNEIAYGVATLDFQF
jgi:hypothetical protein